jgi:adenosylmethionine-8-amino-7-oxononanoate aminotransferase
VAAAWEGKPAPIMHGYTYSGHPLACAAANAVLEIVERERLAANAAARGHELIGGLSAMAERSKIVGEVRGRGLMVGIEFVRDKATKQPFAPADPAMKTLGERSLAEGVIVRTMANKIILSPPLTLEREHVERIVAALTAAVKAAEAGV